MELPWRLRLATAKRCWAGRYPGILLCVFLRAVLSLAGGLTKTNVGANELGAAQFLLAPCPAGLEPPDWLLLLCQPGLAGTRASPVAFRRCNHTDFLGSIFGSAGVPMIHQGLCASWRFLPCFCRGFASRGLCQELGLDKQNCTRSTLGPPGQEVPQVDWQS